MGSRPNMIVAFLLLALGLSCTTTPEVEELPTDEAAVQTIPAEPRRAPTSKEDGEEIPVSRLKIKGTRGGKITFTAPGRPEQIAQSLLDFTDSADHRSWVKKFKALPARGKMRRARWHFEGKAGINPVVELGFWLDGDQKRQRIRYRLVKKDFGLGAFFGDYVIEMKPESPNLSSITERTFIDSGTWIANASYEEIEEGLREDAELITAWLIEKYGQRKEMPKP